ncbi:MAG: M48 family metalloprotease [Alphaproteobacteria bacterium]|nr:M48 family metalloprotease [Alphaproteobacteria bacterium]
MKIWLYSAASVTLIAGAAYTTSSSAQQPVTAAATAPQAISARDKAEGAKAHPQLLEEFGGLYTGPQATYVTRIGRTVAAQSGLAAAPSEFTISLLNSSVNNAFAIPGGYVYVTRQLMALMNNEAELASVLGHEVGHVAAQHSQKRSNKANRAGLGALLATVLGGVLLGDSGARLGQQLGSAIAQRYVLSYSRAQEYEADDLGITYLARSGYEPLAASTMLASLASQTALDARREGRGDKSLPEWASTHPDPASRVVRARQRAGQLVATGHITNRDAFLNMLDGMLYDDDPKQGVVEGSSFRHPSLRLTFNAPAGYVLSNGPSAVSITGNGGQAQFSAAAYQGDLEAYLGQVFRSVGGQTQLTYGAPRRTTINGLPVAYALARASTSSGPVDVTVYAYEFAANQAYHIVAITPLGAVPFDSLFQSVRRLTANEVAAIRARRVSIVTVKAEDSVASLAEKMAYPDYKVERFRVLNGLAEGDALKPGQKVKLIISSPVTP